MPILPPGSGTLCAEGGDGLKVMGIEPCSLPGTLYLLLED
jgi:hypothetical protein